MLEPIEEAESVDYVLPSSIVSPGVGIFLALISLASLITFSVLYMGKHLKKHTVYLMITGCLGLGTALSLFTISTSLSIADEKVKNQQQELTAVNNVFDGFNGIIKLP